MLKETEDSHVLFLTRQEDEKFQVSNPGKQYSIKRCVQWLGVGDSNLPEKVVMPRPTLIWVWESNDGRCQNHNSLTYMLVSLAQTK